MVTEPVVKFNDCLWWAGKSVSACAVGRMGKTASALCRLQGVTFSQSVWAASRLLAGLRLSALYYRDPSVSGGGGGGAAAEKAAAAKAESGPRTFTLNKLYV